jgi:hypothetical protein
VAFTSGEETGGGCQAQTSQVTDKEHGARPVTINLADTEVVYHAIPDNSIRDNAHSRVELIRRHSLLPRSRTLMITHRLGLADIGHFCLSLRRIASLSLRALPFLSL